MAKLKSAIAKIRKLTGIEPFIIRHEGVVCGLEARFPVLGESEGIVRINLNSAGGVDYGMVHVQKAADGDSRPEVDYFPGSWVSTLGQALRFIYRVNDDNLIPREVARLGVYKDLLAKGDREIIEIDRALAAAPAWVQKHELIKRAIAIADRYLDWRDRKVG